MLASCVNYNAFQRYSQPLLESFFVVFLQRPTQAVACACSYYIVIQSLCQYLYDNVAKINSFSPHPSSYRVITYIVISKPKRMSVADGVVHIVILLVITYLHQYVSLLYWRNCLKYIVKIINWSQRCYLELKFFVLVFTYSAFRT